jgi:hypothetical protein
VFDHRKRRDSTFESADSIFDHESDRYTCPGGKILKLRHRNFSSQHPDIDADVSSFANPKYGPANFASWFDPHAVVVMMSYWDTPYCRVIVEGAAWVNEIRPELECLVLVDDFWRVEKLAEQTPAGQRSVFKAQLPKGEAILTITGFDTMKGTIAVVFTAEKPTNP